MSTKRKSKALAKRPTKALARRPKPIYPGEQHLPVLAAGTDLTVLGDDPRLGALGLIEVKLTAAEELVLNEGVATIDVRVKPQGQPYLSHPTYTRWFNRAFGRTGWMLVPCGKPKQTERGVTAPYVLHIHGKPVAFAWGEQDYIESNREQSLGDALEATVASALRRCAKHLGVGLELWDKVWLDGYLQEHAVCVKVVKYDGKESYQWRRRQDPPLKGEQGGSRHREDEPEHRPAPPRTDVLPAEPRPVDPSAGGSRQDVDATPRSSACISEGQAKRLYAITSSVHRNHDAVKVWLKASYGYNSSRDILRSDYDNIIRAIQSPGALPL